MEIAGRRARSLKRFITPILWGWMLLSVLIWQLVPVGTVITITPYVTFMLLLTMAVFLGCTASTLYRVTSHRLLRPAIRMLIIAALVTPLVAAWLSYWEFRVLVESPSIHASRVFWVLTSCGFVLSQFVCRLLLTILSEESMAAQSYLFQRKVA